MNHIALAKSMFRLLVSPEGGAIVHASLLLKYVTLPYMYQEVLVIRTIQKPSSTQRFSRPVFLMNIS